MREGRDLPRRFDLSASGTSRAWWHLVGPFEVESALLEHPAVAESAAVAKPDPVIYRFAAPDPSIIAFLIDS